MPEPLKIPVVYQHKDFLLVNKPAGIGMHSEQGTPGVIALLSQQQQIEKLYPVHRLDTGTSGLLLVAKTAVAAAEFGALFEQHKISKHYVAISDRKPRKKMGWLKGDMEKTRNGSWKLSRTHHNPAITWFVSKGLVLSSIPAKQIENDSGVDDSGTDIDQHNSYRCFYLKPQTGKTHQLRVALKALASPIVGDERYGGRVADRLYLHAVSLAFTYGGEEYEFEALPHSGALFTQPEFKAAYTELSQA